MFERAGGEVSLRVNPGKACVRDDHGSCLRDRYWQQGLSLLRGFSPSLRADVAVSEEAPGIIVRTAALADRAP